MLSCCDQGVSELLAYQGRKAAVLPCRAVQLEPVWPVEVPLRAGVVTLPGLLKGKDLPFDVSLCSVSGLLLAAHKVIIVLSQACPVPARTVVLLSVASDPQLV